MEHEMPEFENKTTSSKDIWLFLIVLDVVILCVFGFFLYKHFSVQLFNSQQTDHPVAIQTDGELAVQVIEPLPQVEEVSLATVGPVDLSAFATKYVEGLDAFNQDDFQGAKAAWLEAQRIDPKNSDVKLGLSRVEEMLSKSQQSAAPVEKTLETPVQPDVQAETRKSILVTPVNGSKYRRVTFRWFKPAQSVSIVSGFTNRKPQALKKMGDWWETTLSIAPGTYKFLYIVDGESTLDPFAEEKDGRSMLVIE